jgi:uncharacterized membrane protein
VPPPASLEKIPLRASKDAANGAQIVPWLWLLLAIYAIARVLQAYPGRVPMLVIVALHVLPPMCFALVHGARAYTVRGILTFVFLCMVVGNLSENLGVATGFPFGHYYFTDVMGPKVLQVPILLGLAYTGMGYLSWTLGRLILGDLREPLSGSRVVTRPLVAAFVMVAWDLSMDPIWSNFVHGWTWREGGSYYGVPVSNFFGWYLTVYLIYQSFALYLRRRPVSSRPIPSGFWELAILFYAVSALGNLFVTGPPGVAVIADASGAQWRVSSILNASALASIFIMGAFALFAWVRLMDRGAASKSTG